MADGLSGHRGKRAHAIHVRHARGVPLADGLVEPESKENMPTMSVTLEVSHWPMGCNQVKKTSKIDATLHLIVAGPPGYCRQPLPTWGDTRGHRGPVAQPNGHHLEEGPLQPQTRDGDRGTKLITSLTKNDRVAGQPDRTSSSTGAFSTREFASCTRR